MFDGERSISFCGMCASVGRASGMKKKKKTLYISGVSSRQMSRGHVSNVT